MAIDLKVERRKKWKLQLKVNGFEVKKKALKPKFTCLVLTYKSFFFISIWLGLTRN